MRAMGVVAPPLPAIPGADRDRLSNFWRNAAAKSRVATTGAVSFRHLALGRAGVGSGQLLRRRKSVLCCSIGADGAVVADKAAGEGERSLAGEDGLTREVVDLAFPALLGQAIEPLALLTETAFVGRLGSVELAAVGVSISAFNYVSKCFNIPLLSVTTSFVAEDDAAVHQSNGNGSGKQVLPAVSSALVLGTAIGLIEALLLGFQGGRLLRLMGVAKDSVMAGPARQYLVFRALAAPAAVLSLTLQGIFRGLKDTKTPLYATAIASSSNIVLGAFLMFGLRLGVAGAAVAYGAAQFAMMSHLLWCLNKRVILLPPKLKDRKFERFFKNGGLLLGRTLSILSIMTLSTSMARDIADGCSSSLYSALVGYVAALGFISNSSSARAFAKRDYRRAKLVTFRVLQMGSVLGMIMAGVIGTSSGFLSKLFTKDEEVLKVMFTIMPFVALTQPLNSLAFVFDGIHYGASDFRYATHAMMVNALASSAVLLYAPRVLGLSGVWVGLTLVMGLRAGAGFLRLALAAGPWSFLKEKLDGEMFLT